MSTSPTALAHAAVLRKPLSPRQYPRQPHRDQTLCLKSKVPQVVDALTEGIVPLPTFVEMDSS
jgi:hypothetical protein